jgi:hypothetical protein
MQRPLKNASFGSTFNDYDTFDLDGLPHPAQAFEHPSHVVTDPDLTLNEKRATLASWASDACAIEAAPAFRRVPGGKRAVGFDEVIEALRTLDKARDQGKDSKCHRHILRRREGFERRAQYFIRRWTGTISQQTISQLTRCGCCRSPFMVTAKRLRSVLQVRRLASGLGASTSALGIRCVSYLTD